MSAEIYKLRPDDSPFARAFRDELYEVIDRHLDRGEMTYAEVIGIIEFAKLDIMIDQKED
jgi:hypothetical protein